jgi:hypothetical protein
LYWSSFPRLQKLLNEDLLDMFFEFIKASLLILFIISVFITFEV